jgi:putative sigma-54 modulation protein
MTILFTGRKAHLTPELKGYIEAKLQKLERVLDDILDVHVILKREKHRHLAEIVVKARRTTLTAKGEGAEFQDAGVRCVDRLLAQAKKHSGRQKTRRKGRGAWTPPRQKVQAAAPEPPDDDGGAALVRMGRVSIRVMSIREALVQAQDNGEPIVVFRNPESREVAVIFRRPDGQFGLVETEA